jgi:hypothetical protein
MSTTVRIELFDCSFVADLLLLLLDILALTCFRIMCSH